MEAAAESAAAIAEGDADGFSLRKPGRVRGRPVSGAAPLVSVVVSARGNGASLEGLLTALARQSLPAAETEVVAVDNDPPREGPGAVARAMAGGEIGRAHV